jgi:hypothetical protein
MLWATPKWSLGILTDFTANASLHQQVGPALNLIAYSDTTIAYGRAWSVESVRFGQLDWGVTAKAVYRGTIDKIVSVASLQNGQDFEKSFFNEGLLGDFDAGVMWHMPEYSEGFLYYLKPTFALNVRNILDMERMTNFGLIDKDKTGNPTKLGRAVDLGSSFRLPNWWVWTSRLAIDVRNIAHPNWTVRKGLHIGAEFLWEMSSWFKGGWRAGLNQGYLTAGFSGQIGIFKLDLATVGEEVGTSSSKKENRYWMTTMSLDF